ncbi:hypothetical protein [Aliiroseovarius halocynthiae]|nr:hypothetical protein [Aliiroseovarius halocynthiae]
MLNLSLSTTKDPTNVVMLAALFVMHIPGAREKPKSPKQTALG